jgi:four helix bundle protein
MPRGQTDLRDQLRHASGSSPLNVAGASGKTSRAERAHPHAITRGLALECAPILDVLALLGAASPEGVDRRKRLLERIVSMLTKMCR